MSNITSNTKKEAFVDGHCNTKLDLKKCTFQWTIDHFSILCARKEEVKSAAFSSCNDDLEWCLKLSFSSFGIGIGEPVSDFSLGLHTGDADHEKHRPVSGKVEFLVMKPSADADGPSDRKAHRQECDFKFEKNKTFYYIARFKSDALKAMTFEDKLTIRFHLKYVTEDGISSIPTSSSVANSFGIAKPSLSVSPHLEWILSDGHFSDVTISVNSKSYPLHKVILAARSPVFYAMFSNDMQENLKNYVEIADIEQVIFEETLHYIYTGTTRNLEELAFEVLPVAEKYELGELKNMCEQVLFKKLSLENAAKILMLADMHRADELKAQTFRFIKQRSSDFNDLKSTEIWNVLTTYRRPELMQEMLAVFFE